MTRSLVFTSLAASALAYPNYLVDHRALSVGGPSIMGVSPAAPTGASSIDIVVTRNSDSTTLEDGDTYLSGESLTISLASPPSNYIMQVNTAALEGKTNDLGDTFASQGFSRNYNINSQTITAPTSGDFVVTTFTASGYQQGYATTLTLTNASPTPVPVPNPTATPGTPTPVPVPSPTKVPVPLPTPPPTSSPQASLTNDDGTDSVTEAGTSPGIATVMLLGAALLFGAPLVAYFSFYNFQKGELHAGDSEFSEPAKLIQTGQDL